MRLLRLAQRFCVQKRFSHVVKSTLGEIEIPNKTITQHIFNNYEQWQDKPLITCSTTKRSLTYGQVKKQIGNLSSSLLQKVGLKRGQVIGLILPNIPEYIPTLHGALEAGLVVTFVNPIYTEDEVYRQFSNAEAVCIVVIPELKEIADKVGAKLPGYKGTITVGPGGDFNLLELCQPDPQLKPVDHSPDVHDLAILPYSSGTTGLPKGVMLSHYNCVANVEQMKHPKFAVPPTTDTYQEKSLTVLPFFHIYGLNGIQNFAIRNGMHLITMPRFTPENYMNSLLEYRPTTLFLVPSLMLFLASNPNVTSNHLSSVQRVISGAAPATKTLIDLFKEKTKNPDVVVQQGFGMTETSPCAIVTPHDMPLDKAGSTGVLLASTEAKVISLKTGAELPANENGELCIRGPQVMKGYLKNQKATEDTIDSEGWLHTGDVAYYDEDQYFYITDRTKELIKVKGNQVSPTELESLLLEIPGITDAAVIGIPDEICGEIPKAFIVCQPDTKLVDTEIQKYVESRVAPYKRLAGGVHFLPVIPRNATGKILRQELKKLY